MEAVRRGERIEPRARVHARLDGGLRWTHAYALHAYANSSQKILPGTRARPGPMVVYQGRTPETEDKGTRGGRRGDGGTGEKGDGRRVVEYTV